VLGVRAGEREALVVPHRRRVEERIAGAADVGPTPRRRRAGEEELALERHVGVRRLGRDARIARRRAVDGGVAAEPVVRTAVAVVVELVATLVLRADRPDARTPRAELVAGAGGAAVGAAADAAAPGRADEAFLDVAGAADAAFVDGAVAVVVEAVAHAVGAAVFAGLAAGVRRDRLVALRGHLRRHAHRVDREVGVVGGATVAAVVDGEIGRAVATAAAAGRSGVAAGAVVDRAPHGAAARPSDQQRRHQDPPPLHSARSYHIC